jgi:hypothetical protein
MSAAAAELPLDLSRAVTVRSRSRGAQTRMDTGPGACWTVTGGDA